MVVFSDLDGLVRFFWVLGLLLSVEVMFDGFVVVVLLRDAGLY